MANAPEVIIIPARKKIGNRVVKENEKKIHVAAYCRVSTDSDEQEELRSLINTHKRYLNQRDASSFAYAKEVLELLGQINFKETEGCIRNNFFFF